MAKIEFLFFKIFNPSIQLLTIPSYLDLYSGSNPLNVIIAPSCNPIKTSDYFLDSLKRILFGKLPNDIFWNV